MSKRNLFIALIIVLALAVSACNITTLEGSGKVIREERAMSDIDSVELTGMGELIITQGDEESLFIETDDNLMQYIKTRTEGSTLVIELDPSLNPGEILRPTDGIIYHLSLTNLTDLAVSGAAKVSFTDGLSTDTFQVELSGAADANLTDLDVEKLILELSGAGDLRATGTATEQAITLSGLGSYNAGDLESESVEVELSGGGVVTVWATDYLNMILSGAGSIEYYGSPQVDQNISGAGSVDSLGNK